LYAHLLNSQINCRHTCTHIAHTTRGRAVNLPLPNEAVTRPTAHGDGYWKLESKAMQSVAKL